MSEPHKLAVAIDPRTGELLEDLHQVSDEQLAGVLLSLEETQRRWRDSARLVREELQSRLGSNLEAQRGPYHVSVNLQAEWDLQDLEGVARELGIDMGNLVRVKHEPDRRALSRLADTLTGAQRDELVRCRSWRVKSLNVTRTSIEGEASEERSELRAPDDTDAQDPQRSEHPGGLAALRESPP